MKKIRTTIIYKCIINLILCSLLVMMIISTPFSAAEEPEYSDRIIVCMGDSYSSGEGIEPFFGQYDETALKIDNSVKIAAKNSDKIKNPDWLAHRSMNAWSGMLKLKTEDGKLISMSSHKDENWYFTAVSGAKTINISETKQEMKYNLDNVGKDSEPLPLQIDIFKKLEREGKKADYVVMTLGGNDAKFTEIITNAALLPTITVPSLLYISLKNVIEKDLPTIKHDLKTTYSHIYDESKKAQLIIVGYPHLLSSLGGLAINMREAMMINYATDIFNGEIKSIVDSYSKDKVMKIDFVSVTGAFSGHEAYSDIDQVAPISQNQNGDPLKGEYINRIVLTKQSQDLDLKNKVGPSAYSMHPNLKGAKAYARCVQAKIDELESKRVITTKKAPTEKETVNIPNDDTKTQANDGESLRNVLKSGYWIRYSPQAMVFDAYSFIDNEVTKDSYSFENGVFNLYKRYRDVYSVDGNTVTISDVYGTTDWVYNTDSEMIASWQDITPDGNTFSYDQIIFHHDELPDYETAVYEKSNSYK